MTALPAVACLITALIVSYFTTKHIGAAGIFIAVFAGMVAYAVVAAIVGVV